MSRRFAALIAAVVMSWTMALAAPAAEQKPEELSPGRVIRTFFIAAAEGDWDTLKKWSAGRVGRWVKAARRDKASRTADLKKFGQALTKVGPVKVNDGRAEATVIVNVQKILTPATARRLASYVAFIRTVMPKVLDPVKKKVLTKRLADLKDGLLYYQIKLIKPDDRWLVAGIE